MATPLLRTRKYPLRPTPEQAALLTKWIGAARWTYNHCLALVDECGMARNEKTLRAAAIRSDSPALRENPWLVETPDDIRDEAMRDLLKAYKTCFSQLGSKRIKTFKCKFRSKKDPSQTITLKSRVFTETKKDGKTFLRLFMRRAGVDPRIRGMEGVPFPLAHDARLQRTRLGQWFLITQTDIKPGFRLRAGPKIMPLAPTHRKRRIVAIDPGVRTFAACYDADGLYWEFGAGDMQKLYRLGHAYDDLQSRWTKEKAARRYRMKRAGLRILQRMRNLTDDMHWKIAATLCPVYDEILLPRFETSQMVEKVNSKTGKKRCIGSKTARAMLTWRHWMFRCRLKSKAEEYGTRITDCTEEYTSKTCGRCGRVKWNLGGAKRYTCKGCGLAVDRDFNGARNILMKCAPAEYDDDDDDDENITTVLTMIRAGCPRTNSVEAFSSL
jgi:putative transposase